VSPGALNRSFQSAQPSTNRFQWAQLEAEDYPTYIARLRSIGCPEQTIRDIIIADIDKLMAPQIIALNGHTNPPKYWKAEPRDSSVLQSLEQLDRIADLDVEKRGIVKELLGIDLAAERLRQKGETDIYEERLGFLPEAKRSQVRLLIEKANREEVYLREKSWTENDSLTAAEQDRLREIHREKERSIQDILTAAEYEQYDLWFSPSAYRVRDTLSGMDNTEEEFVGIYRIQSEFDSKWGEVEPASLNPTQKAQYDADRTQLEKDIRDFLGAERFAQYQEVQDNDYRELMKTAAQFNLPPDAARDVYAFKSIAEEQRSKIRNDLTLSPEERQNVLQAINEETEKAVVGVVGGPAYKQYVRSGAGKWISE